MFALAYLSFPKVKIDLPLFDVHRLFPSPPSKEEKKKEKSYEGAKVGTQWQVKPIHPKKKMASESISICKEIMVLFGSLV